MQTEQILPFNQNFNAKNHQGVGNGIRWMCIGLEQTPLSNSNTPPTPPPHSNTAHYDDMIIPSFLSIKHDTLQLG